MNDKITKKTRSFTALAVMLAFILPLILAVGLYITRDHWALASTPNGVLLSPPLQWPLHLEQRQWHLLVVTPTCIDATCELLLAKVTSIHEATGKDFKRISNVLVTSTSDVNKKLLENFYDIRWIEPTGTPIPELGLYIVDPNGYIILKYRLDVPAKDILEDLRHLLKVSQIG